MNAGIVLSKREVEIAEYAAWGATQKEIANYLYISERTVDNHIRNIYEKVGCHTVNALSAWWFCTRFNISFDLSPMKRKCTAIALLLLLMPQVWQQGETIVRAFRTKTISSRTIRHRTESNVFLIDFV